MSNYTRHVIGTFVVREPTKVHELFEYAAYHRDLIAPPGTYTAVVYLDGGAWSEGSLGATVYVEIPQATVTSAHFGDCGREEVGTTMKTSIKLPTYCLHDYVLDGRLTLDESLVSFHDHAFSEGYVRRYYHWRAGMERVRMRRPTERCEPTTEVAL